MYWTKRLADCAVAYIWCCVHRGTNDVVNLPAMLFSAGPSATLRNGSRRKRKLLEIEAWDHVHARHQTWPLSISPFRDKPITKQ